MKVYIVFMIFLQFFSCNQGKFGESKKGDLLITISLRVLEDDKIELFYSGKTSLNRFDENQKFSQLVKGSSKVQKIKFRIPIESNPLKLRIDLGDNRKKKVSIIAVKEIELKRNGNVIRIDESLVNSFFQSNVYLQKTEQGYLRRIVNNKYDPYLVSKPILSKKIKIEL